MAACTSSPGPGTPERPHSPGPMMDTQTTSCTATTAATMESMESVEEFDQYGNVVSVGDITFLDETLGSGAYATVRLARRRRQQPKPTPTLRRRVSPPSPPSGPGPGGCKRSHPTPTSSCASISASAPALPTIASSSRDEEGDTASPPAQDADPSDAAARGYLGIGHFGKRIARAALSSLMSTDSGGLGDDVGVGGGVSSTNRGVGACAGDGSDDEDMREGVGDSDGTSSDCFDTAASSSDGYISSSQCSSIHGGKGGGDGDGEGELVAVKCFSKSLLKRMRTMERSSVTQKVQIHTALERVEREIALMKMMRHPNIVSMLEVIDSQDSDALYMVLEYMPRGEIMTFDEDEVTFSRVDRPGEPPLKGVVDGHFDEKTAALYFVDVLHGLAYLHQNGICHRDLKPENILLDANGQVKIGDFGVSHFFEDEKDRGPTRLWHRTESSVVRNSYHPAMLSRMDTDSALAMKGMHNRGMLKRTEGTWCFWAPEMCSEESGPFSGYAADIWSAGICLYIFVTGRLPFYSEVPTELFDMIARADVPYDPATMSPQLISILRMLLEKDPEKRAGLGDCLKHPFCAAAREQRIRALSSELRHSSRKLVVSEEDVRKAFKRVSVRSAEAVIRSAALFKQRLDSARNLIKKESGMSRASSSLMSSLPPSRGSPVSTCMEDDTRSADFASQKSTSTVSDTPEMTDTEHQSSLSTNERDGADGRPGFGTSENDDEGAATQFCRIQ